MVAKPALRVGFFVFVIPVSSLFAAQGGPPTTTLLNRHTSSAHILLQSKESPPVFSGGTATGSVTLELNVEANQSHFKSEATMNYSGVPVESPDATPHGVLILPAAVILGDFAVTLNTPITTSVGTYTFMKYVISDVDRTVKTSGTIMDAAGRPLPNAFVQALMCLSPDSRTDRCRDPNAGGQTTNPICALRMLTNADGQGNFSLVHELDLRPNNRDS